MKKYLFVFSLSLFCFACGNNSADKDKASETTEKAAPSPMDNPDYDKGLNLIAKSDCLTCHKLREPLVGPSYGDVANKYPNTEANVDSLADKIVKGGTGVWGTAVMTAHPGISKEDAKQMVKYILLLKDEKK